VFLAKYYTGDEIKNSMDRTCGTRGGDEVYAEFWWRNLREGVHLEDM
jgi:hypothetical protein